MNLLIFDPSFNQRQCCSLQAITRRFRWIVRIKDIRELFTQLPVFARPFNVIVLIIPAVRIRRNGCVIARSRRAEIILEIARAAAHARLHTIILPQAETPLAFFDEQTGKELSGGEVFFRPIDQATNTFRGCVVDRDWQRILEDIW